MKIFKVVAEGDTVYLKAKDLDDAKNILKVKIGPIPDRLLAFSEVDSVPKDEELL